MSTLSCGHRASLLLGLALAVICLISVGNGRAVANESTRGFRVVVASPNGSGWIKASKKLSALVSCSATCRVRVDMRVLMANEELKTHVSGEIEVRRARSASCLLNNPAHRWLMRNVKRSLFIVRASAYSLETGETAVDRQVFRLVR